MSRTSGQENPALKSSLKRWGSMTTAGAQAVAGLIATVRPAPPSVTTSWASVTMTSSRGLPQTAVYVKSQTLVDTSHLLITISICASRIAALNALNVVHV